MTPESVPYIVAALAAGGIFAPVIVSSRPVGLLRIILAAVALALSTASIFCSTGPFAFGLIAVLLVLRGLFANQGTDLPKLPCIVSTLFAVAAALTGEWPVLNLIAAVLLLATLSGAWPMHWLAARVIDRSPLAMAEQISTCIVATFAYLRFVAPTEFAFDAASTLVRLGAVLALLPAITALVQVNLRGFYRCVVAMHGGMLIAALGAAGHGHSAAALLVTVTLALAMGGLGAMVAAVEDRCGRVLLKDQGGRIWGMPRLAAAFLLFAASGVGMPGTAGFIADDLLLHALWEESVVGSLIMIVAAALLAVASLAAFAKIFLGPPATSLAGDLRQPERYVVIATLGLLVLIGMAPWLLANPLAEYLRGFGAVPH